MGYERPYYTDLNYHPLLFYVIFGVKDEELVVSRKKHHVDEFPEGLDCFYYQKPQNSEYMESIIGGNLGGVLKNSNPVLYEEIKHTDKWAVIRGEARQDNSMDYMRNVIGYIQAFMENGALGVLDLQTFTLYAPNEWENKIFSREFGPYDHVVILTSEENDGMWLHTRGMRKFGRPDISMENVGKNNVDEAAMVINQMIYYGALGVFFSQPTKLHTYSGNAYVVTPEFVNDFDNSDFNNAYYRIDWQECENKFPYS